MEDAYVSSSSQLSRIKSNQKQPKIVFIRYRI